MHLLKELIGTSGERKAVIIAVQTMLKPLLAAGIEPDFVTSLDYNTVSTRFDIASVTKIFTAAAVMQLVDRDEIGLDTRVMPFIGVEGTKISDDVTVYHCLTHTSGIGDDADEG